METKKKTTLVLFLFFFLLFNAVIVSGVVVKTDTKNSMIKKTETPVNDFVTWDAFIDGFGIRGIIEIDDGGYVYLENYLQECAHPDQFSGKFSIKLTEIDLNGEKIWESSFDYDGYNYDLGQDFEQTSDDGFIIVGYHNIKPQHWFNNIWLIKTDSQGNKEWDRIFNFSSLGLRHVQPHSIKQLDFNNDGTKDGYVIVGETSYSPLNQYGIFVIKTDINGENEKVEFFFDSNIYITLLGRDFEQLNNGNIIIIGGIFNRVAETDEYPCFFLKIDKDFNYVGHKLIQDAGSGNCIHLISENEAMILTDYRFIKTNLDGDEIWRKDIGGNYFDTTNDNGYVIVGTIGTQVMWSRIFVTLNNIRLTKTNSNGDTIWDTSFTTSTQKYYPDTYYPRSATGLYVQQTNDGGFIVGGTGGNESLMHCSWLIKTGEKPESNNFKSRNFLKELLERVLDKS